MKKLVIFLSLSLVLLAVGCKKEDIRPNHRCDSNATSHYEKGNLNEDPTNDDGKPNNPITDPNHDEDEEDKIKK